MCRIFGHFSYEKNNLIPVALQNSSDLQLAGGPDQRGAVYGDTWGIGANRLAIQGLKKLDQTPQETFNDEAQSNLITGGQQPYSFEDNIYAVFNGEIYNHEELRQNLEAKGYKFSDKCDGTILPALYAEYGERCVELLDGMFSFAITDLRKKTKHFIAVDPMGIKPLYYFCNDEKRSFSFASEIPGLVVFPGVEAELSPFAVDEYFTTRIPMGGRTMYEGISSLEPSHTISIEHGMTPQIRKYQTRVNKDCDYSNITADQAPKVFRELFSDEVRKILECDVPVSLITSGGVDSSLILSLARTHKDNLHTFHVCTKGDWPMDERQYARKVSEYCGLGNNYHEIEVDLKDFPDLIENFSKSLGQPDTAPQSLGTYAMAGAIRDSGFKVTVGGEGSDELFGGYDRIARAIRDPDDSWLYNYIKRLAPFDAALKWSLYSDDYNNFIGGQSSSEAKVLDLFQPDSLGKNLSQEERLKHVLAFEQKYRLPAHLLRRADHITMANSIEMRVPFCQPKIVNFANQLSVDAKICGDQVKRTVYRAGDGILPDFIVNREKQHFILPITAMYRSKDPVIREFMKDTLASKKNALENCVSDQAVQDILDKDPDTITNQEVLALWSITVGRLTTQYVMDVAAKFDLENTPQRENKFFLKRAGDPTLEL